MYERSIRTRSTSSAVPAFPTIAVELTHPLTPFGVPKSMSEIRPIARWKNST